jgi:chemotaxis protein CheY-P-specific phosphatase CheC
MITMNNNILNSSTTSLSEVIDNKIKIFANDIDNSDDFNSNQVNVLMRTSYLLTKLSLINAELQLVENEIISIQKSDYYTKENRMFNKMLKEEINALNWTLQKIKNF